MNTRLGLTIGIVVVLILAILIGTFVYLNKLFSAPSSSPSVITSNPGQMVIPSTGPVNSASPSTLGTSNKTYSGPGFSFSYPASWGILTCTNSQNLELDPSSGDQRIVCDSAIKPITFLVGSGGCQGQTQTLGRTPVIKSRQVLSDGYTKYDWCTQTSPLLHISERVSQNGEMATSKVDYSQSVEQIISTLSFGIGGS